MLSPNIVTSLICNLLGADSLNTYDLHLLGHLAWIPGALSAVDFSFLRSLIQHVGRTAALRSKRGDGLPIRPILCLVVESQTNDAVTHFRRKLTRCFVRDAPHCSGVCGRTSACYRKTLDGMDLQLPAPSVDFDKIRKKHH